MTSSYKDGEHIMRVAVFPPEYDMQQLYSQLFLYESLEHSSYLVVYVKGAILVRYLNFDQIRKRLN